jgi:arylsulfatase A-like enzyme
MRQQLLYTALCVVASSFFVANHTVRAKESPPNIIFFLSDDQRADFLGCAGHPIVKTPNIDTLASQGVRFENAFVTTSICAASRATLFTGLWERSHKYTFGTPPIAKPMIDASYPVQLRKSGYRTGFVGKFGVGVGPGEANRMFDSFVPLNRHPYFKKQADGSQRHLTDIAGDKAIDFVESCSDKQPFCLSVSFNAAHAEDSDKENHYPWPQSEDGLYDNITIPPPLVRTDFWKELPAFFHNSMHRDRWFWRWDTPEKYQKNVKAYYRMITGLDRNIGRVLEAVNRRGMSDNTVVIFMGDNGYYKGSRGFAGKWSHYEESLRVPLVMYDPRASSDKQGRVDKAMRLNVDVAATIVDLATDDAPETYQGSSFSDPARDILRTDFFCEHLMDHPDIPKWEGVRGDRFVYARYFENMPEGEFLHDLQADPQQLKNLINDTKYKDALDKMRSRCNELRDQYGGKYTHENFPTVRRMRAAGKKQSAPKKSNSEKNNAAKGVVYLDSNANQQFDAGDKPIPNVRVSNGRDIVRTNAKGKYELTVDRDDIIFVIKPKGYRTPLSEDKLPQFYYIHKPDGSPNLKFKGVEPTGELPSSIDFPLYEQKEPEQFRAILFGDPQPRTQREVDFMAHDVVEELIGADASFGVTLGDIVFDDLDVFVPLNKTVALIGIPWYNVIGNHDINLDAQGDDQSDETFERIYGPAYYSFDYGQVHFMVLDDIEWHHPTPGGKGTYRGGLGDEQMAFIRNDLAMIPEDQLVVLLMHVPLVNVRDREELYRLIEKRPFCVSVSGHTHHHEHRFIKKEDGWLGPEPHHHIINVTVSGSWWSGAPDERGIPHTAMADGAPNGYSIISFDGTKYKLDFKAAGRSADYQMQISAPEVVSINNLDATTIYANVFNGSERSKVEMRVGKDAAWTVMQQTREVDPQLQRTYEAEAKAIGKPANWKKMTKPKNSTHLWKAKLSSTIPTGTHLIEIRETDMNGRVVTGQRVIRVAPGK